MHIGVDTGGTFTDVVAFDPATGALAVHKVSSTPDDPARAVIEGLKRALEARGAGAGALRHLVHGTTVATNAVLTGNWAPIALVTTEGFRDALEIGRQTRPELYNFHTVKPEPLVPRARRFEVPERVDASGAVVRPLDEAAVGRVAKAIAASGARAVAVVLLFSFKNPDHERRVGALLRDALDLPVSLSCEVLPEFREYERASTTALNAALLPVVDRYLATLDEATRALGAAPGWRVMQSNAGTTSAELARRAPVTLLLSGPAGGVEGARFVGEQTGHPNLITLDMGGTSCDVALIHRGRPRLTSEGAIAARPVRVPMVDIHTIGAGGGSLAWIDPGGALRVCPQSAGAQPGPAAYGRGGTEPAVTDAQLVLGRFDAAAPLGDIPKLDLEAARRAVADRVAGPLGMSLEDAAAGVLTVAEANMEQAIRLISVERGHDPRRFALLAFGGAGPLHGARLAERMGIPTVIVPTSAGVLSAFGLLTADLSHHFVRTVLGAGETDWDALNAALNAFRQQGAARLADDGVPPERQAFSAALDLRYVGQSFELTVPAPDGALEPAHWDGIAKAFHQAHQQRYGHHDAVEPVEVVNVRLVAQGALRKPAFPALSEAAGRPEPDGARRVHFAATGWLDCPAYARERLGAGACFAGPAVVDGVESTVVVPPGWGAVVSAHGHLVLERA